jgi:hypothetical protein
LLLRNDFPEAESGSGAISFSANAFTRIGNLAVRQADFNVATYNTAFEAFCGKSIARYFTGSGVVPQVSLDETMFPTMVCGLSTAAYMSGTPFGGGAVEPAGLSVVMYNTAFGPSCEGSTAPYIPGGGMVPQVSLDETIYAMTVCRPSMAAYVSGALFSGGVAQQAGPNVAMYDTAVGASCGGLIARYIPCGGTTQHAAVNVLTLDESASVDPGSQPLNLPPSLSRCLRALCERQTVLSAAQAVALKRQLQFLLEDEEELQSANISVSVRSLHGLIDFLSEHRTCALPSLSITRAGYFAASWSPRKRAKLTIVFRPDGVADWIASDLDATPPVHQKDILANRQGELAAWANA